MQYRDRLKEMLEAKRAEVEMITLAAAIHDELREKERYIKMLLMDPDYYEQERLRLNMEADEHA